MRSLGIGATCSGRDSYWHVAGAAASALPGDAADAMAATSKRSVTDARLGGSAHSRDSTRISPIAWKAEPELELSEWLLCGRRIARMQSASNWWIGDWVRYGNVKYGQRYERAAKVVGYDPQTLMNMAYVSSRFPDSRRRAALSWSHHAELAALPEPDQETWLDLLEREPMSVRSLRDEMRRTISKRVGDRATSAASEIERSPDAPCPLCGCPTPSAHSHRPSGP